MLGKLIMQKIQTKKAFTLVEILVVMVIIGILIGLGIFGLSFAQKSAKDTDKKAALAQMALAMESYYSLNRKYPACSGAVTDTFIATLGSNPPLSPAKNTTWADYTCYSQNGLFYFKVTMASKYQQCSDGNNAYYGGGVSTTGQSFKDALTIDRKCWIN
jgi:prepilin-type N-terminal cleavage/methylation domain-containing protein